MKCDISKTTAPKMPNLGRGLKNVALLPSQASKDMQEPIVPMLFPILGAHVSGAKFMYPDLSWKEMSGMMANLGLIVAPERANCRASWKPPAAISAGTTTRSLPSSWSVRR